MSRHSATSMRSALVEQLEAGGWLRTPEWRQAFLDVPRDVFVPRCFRLTSDGESYEAVDRRDGDWLHLVYSDIALTTQLDGDDRRWSRARAEGPVRGTPTSSSSQPSLMAVMLEALELDTGRRVLEVGTGTGYNAALLCHRYGDGHVTTIEYDAGLASTARCALADAGYHPTTEAGDGEAGWPRGTPYDGVLATYAVTRIPPAWLAELQPGGVIVASLHRDLDVGLLARFVVGDDGQAHGCLLSANAYFMPTRLRGTLGVDALVRAALAERGVVRAAGPTEPISDEPTGWTAFAGLLLPELARRDIYRDDGHVQWLVHPDGSWAYYEARAGTVEQGGPRRLWDQLERLYTRWQQLGAPDRSRLGFTVDRKGNGQVRMLSE